MGNRNQKKISIPFCEVSSREMNNEIPSWSLISSESLISFSAMCIVVIHLLATWDSWGFLLHSSILMYFHCLPILGVLPCLCNNPGVIRFILWYFLAAVGSVILETALSSRQVSAGLWEPIVYICHEVLLWCYCNAFSVSSWCYISENLC